MFRASVDVYICIENRIHLTHLKDKNTFTGCFAGEATDPLHLPMRTLIIVDTDYNYGQ